MSPTSPRASAAWIRWLAVLGGLGLVALLVLRLRPGPQPPPLFLTTETTDESADRLPLAAAPGPPRLDPGGFPAGAVAAVGSTRFHHRDLIQPVAFGPDGRTLYVGTAEHDALYAWDAATGERRWRLTFAERPPVARLPGRSLDPRDIGTVGGRPVLVTPDPDGRECVVCYDPATGGEAARVRLDPPPAVRAYRFSPDGSRVAVANGHDLAVYDTTTGRRLFARQTETEIGGQEGLDFSPDGRALAVGDYTGGVRLFRADNGEPVLTCETGYTHSPVGVRFGRGGSVLVVRSMTTGWTPVLLIDATTGAVRHRLEMAGDMSHVWSSALGPNGAELYVACREYPTSGELRDMLIVWDTGSGRELRRFSCPLPHHLAVSPDGRVLATADGRTVELLDAATGRSLPQSSDPVGGYEELRATPGGGWVSLSAGGVDRIDVAGQRTTRLPPGWKRASS